MGLHACTLFRHTYILFSPSCSCAEGLTPTRPPVRGSSPLPLRRLADKMQVRQQSDDAALSDDQYPSLSTVFAIIQTKVRLHRLMCLDLIR